MGILQAILFLIGLLVVISVLSIIFSLIVSGRISRQEELDADAKRIVEKD